MAGLCPPLPTLRRRPRGRQRTARGRCGSLHLHRSGLAPPTPCRSPGALRVLPPQPRSRSLSVRSFHWEVELRLSAEMLFFGRAQLDVAPNLVGRLIIVTARAVQQTTRQMKHELSNGGVCPPHKNPLIEPEDPDCRVHAAWLAQVSKAGGRLLAKEAGGSTKVSTSASAPADRLAGQEVRLAPAHVDRRTGLITKVLIGCIFAAVITAVIAIPSYLSFFELWQQPTGDPIELTSPDPGKSATRPMQNKSETPKL